MLLVSYPCALSLTSRTLHHQFCFFFFFNDTATTEIYTLSLHDALPIWAPDRRGRDLRPADAPQRSAVSARGPGESRERDRSEEHTSELQSRLHLVCRLLLEKKKTDEER